MIFYLFNYQSLEYLMMKLLIYTLHILKYISIKLTIYFYM